MLYLVSGHMFLDIRFLSKGPTTDNALKWFLSCMGSYVLLEVKVFGKLFVAICALKKNIESHGKHAETTPII